MSLKRIAMALGAATLFGILAVGSVAAAGVDLSPTIGNLAQQASPTGTPSPGNTGNAGLVGQDGSMSLMVGAALVLGAAALAGTGRWMVTRRS